MEENIHIHTVNLFDDSSMWVADPQYQDKSKDNGNNKVVTNSFPRFERTTETVMWIPT